MPPASSIFWQPAVPRRLWMNGTETVMVFLKMMLLSIDFGYPVRNRRFPVRHLRKSFTFWHNNERNLSLKTARALLRVRAVLSFESAAKTSAAAVLALQCLSGICRLRRQLHTGGTGIQHIASITNHHQLLNLVWVAFMTGQYFQNIIHSNIRARNIIYFDFTIDV